jgi:hypothetical protein
VAGDLGVQVKTRFRSGHEQVRFVPIQQVKDVKVIEGIHRWSIVHVLVAIQHNAKFITIFKVLYHFIIH